MLKHKMIFKNVYILAVKPHTVWKEDTTKIKHMVIIPMSDNYIPASIKYKIGDNDPIAIEPKKYEVISFKETKWTEVEFKNETDELNYYYVMVK